VSERCADLSLAAGESLAATATVAERWLLIEAPGAWPVDVADARALPDAARNVVSAWLERTPRSRLLFIRRPGRTGRRLLVFVIRAEESRGDIRRLELESHSELARVDLETAGAEVDGSLVLVCGHGTRDACCALRGTAAYGALAERLEDERVWISSHQGGHRFAPNVVVLPEALQFGRVPLSRAPLLVARALAGRIELDCYRGRTCYEPSVQAAERAVREAAALDGVGELRLAGVEGPVVRLRLRDGAEYAVLVQEVGGPVVPASCGEEPRARSAFLARVL
jgi:hypothetical protein